MERIILNAETYTLKTLVKENASKSYQQWLKDDEIVKTLDGDSKKWSREDLEIFIYSHDNITKFIFGIFTQDNEHLGNFRILFDKKNRIANMGLIIGNKNYWGTSIVNICRKTLINWIFKNNINKIESRPMSINLPAIFNFIKQGWSAEGILREHYFKDGKSIDAISFGLTKKDWGKRK
jgi:[ribosomal protein S5]-alanine N-acetyltransferase